MDVEFRKKGSWAARNQPALYTIPRATRLTTPAAAVVTRANFYGPTGELNAVDVALGSDPSTGVTDTVWTFADPTGAIRSFARKKTTSGWSVQHRLTDEFGNQYALEGNAGALNDNAINEVPLYFNGAERDPATGLYASGSRWYDSTAGRFLTATESGDGGGYAFVPENPMDEANGYPSGGKNGSSSNTSNEPNAFDTIGGFGYGVWDSLAFGHFEDVLGLFTNVTGASAEARQTYAYWAGLGVGAVGQIALGNWAAGALKTASVGSLSYNLARGAQGYALAGDVVGIYDSYEGIRSGNFSALDLLGFAPTIGFATSGAQGLKALATAPPGSRKAILKFLNDERGSISILGKLDDADDAARIANNAPTKVVPNPGGRLGNAATRAKASEVVDDLVSRGFTEIQTEVRFRPGSLGSGKERFADIVGRTIKSDPRVPVIRERNALDDIIFSPDIRNFPNSTIRFVDVNRPGVIQP